MFNSMFGELKEVNYFEKKKQNKTKKKKQIQKSYNVKYFKQIKRLKSLQKLEAYLEPKRVSTMELFCKYT